MSAKARNRTSMPRETSNQRSSKRSASDIGCTRPSANERVAQPIEWGTSYREQNDEKTMEVGSSFEEYATKIKRQTQGKIPE